MKDDAYINDDWGRGLDNGRGGGSLGKLQMLGNSEWMKQEYATESCMGPFFFYLAAPLLFYLFLPFLLPFFSL